MKDYKRLTKWSELGTLHVFDINGKEIPLYDVSPVDTDNLAGRLADLEDKIERGELISTVQAERGEQEIAFFVAHNATVRKQAVEKFASSLKAEFYGDWQRGNISERTYNFIIGEILFVLSIEGYGE